MQVQRICRLAGAGVRNIRATSAAIPFILSFRQLETLRLYFPRHDHGGDPLDRKRTSFINVNHLTALQRLWHLEILSHEDWPAKALGIGQLQHLRSLHLENVMPDCKLPSQLTSLQLLAHQDQEDRDSRCWGRQVIFLPLCLHEAVKSCTSSLMHVALHLPVLGNIDPSHLESVPCIQHNTSLHLQLWDDLQTIEAVMPSSTWCAGYFSQHLTPAHQHLP